MKLIHLRWRPALLALVLGLSLGWAAGCGSKESSTTAAGGGESQATELAAVNPADPASYAQWLKANGVDAPEVSLSGTRGVNEAVAAVPLLPRGEVRLEGLTLWSIEIDRMEFDPKAGGVLEFRKGKKLLWRDSAPFDPRESLVVKGGLPKDVLDAVKVNDTVSWGIVYPGDPKRSVLAEFKVINKPAVAKQIDRLENDRQNARQPAKVKALGRNQLLLNNSLYAEALLGYLDLAVGEANDPIVGDSCYRIVECMRRLRVDEQSPLLFEAASRLARHYDSKVRGKPKLEGDDAPTTGLVKADDYVSSGAKPIPEPTPPDAVPPTQPTTPERTKPTDEQTRRAIAAVDAQAAAAQKRADEAAARDRLAHDQSVAQESKVAALRQAAQAAAGTPEEAPAREALAQAEAALAEARADQAGAQHDNAEANVDKQMFGMLRHLADGDAPVPPPHNPPSTREHDPNPPVPSGTPGDPQTQFQHVLDRAKATDADADRLLAEAKKLAGEADAAKNNGDPDAGKLRKAAKEAAKDAAEARAKANQAQRDAEAALIAAGQQPVPPTAPNPAGEAPGAPPSLADFQKVYAGWVERLEQEAADARAQAEATAAAAEEASAAGDQKEAKKLHKQALRQVQEAVQAARRAEGAKQALDSMIANGSATWPGVSAPGKPPK